MEVEKSGSTPLPLRPCFPLAHYIPLVFCWIVFILHYSLLRLAGDAWCAPPLSILTLPGEGGGLGTRMQPWYIAASASASAAAAAAAIDSIPGFVGWLLCQAVGWCESGGRTMRQLHHPIRTMLASWWCLWNVLLYYGTPW